MSSGGYAAPLHLELDASRRLAAALSVMHGGAMVLLWQLDIYWPVVSGLSLLVAASLAVTIRRHVLRRSGDAIMALFWDSDGQWHLYTRNGEALPAILAVSSSYLHPHLVVLNFRTEGRRFPVPVVILRDSLPVEQLRWLRVRLRLEAGRSEEPIPY